MTTTILVGMPKELSTAQECFPNLNIIQYLHKPDFNLDALIPKNCNHIIAFGLSGGLAPGLKVADIVIASIFTDGKFKYICTDLTIKADYLTIKQCPYYSNGIENESNTVEQRAQVFKQTGAWAMDDESFFGYQIAQQRNIKFSIIRSISDDWTMTLPPAATGAIMNADGSANTEYLAQSLATDPSQIGSLINLAWDFGYSLHTLYLAGKLLTGII